MKMARGEIGFRTRRSRHGKPGEQARRNPSSGVTEQLPPAADEAIHHCQSLDLL